MLPIKVIINPHCPHMLKDPFRGRCGHSQTCIYIGTAMRRRLQSRNIISLGDSVACAVGERSAVGPNSGATVSQSVPGLRRPTPPATAGRKSAARPPVLSRGAGSAVAAWDREAELTAQSKTGRGAGQSHAQEIRREAPNSISPSVSREAGTLNAPNAELLDDYSTRQLIEFLETLDQWDREAHGN